MRVQLVLFHSESWLDRLGVVLDAASREAQGGLDVVVWDNSPERSGAGDWCLSHGWRYVPSAEGNVGYGAGHNRLAALAPKECEFLLLLNPDGVPFPGTIARLEAVARARPRAALVEAAQFPIEHPKRYDPQSLETDWCSGACLLVRTSAFTELGGFDHQLFLYCEDVDLGWRAWAAGWQCLYVPWARFLHVTGAQDLRKSRRHLLLHEALGGLYLRRKYFGDGEAERFLQSIRPHVSQRFLTELRALSQGLQVAPAAASSSQHARLESGGAYAERRW